MFGAASCCDVYGATVSGGVSADDQVKCGWTLARHTQGVCKWNQSEPADGVLQHRLDLVFVSKEVTSNRLCSNLHLFVSQDTFGLHSVASSSFHSQPNTVRVSSLSNFNTLTQYSHVYGADMPCSFIQALFLSLRPKSLRHFSFGSQSF